MNIDIYEEFKQVENLGASIPCVFIVKTMNKKELFDYFKKWNVGGKYSSSKEREIRIDNGFVTSGVLGEDFLSSAEYIWKKEFIIPYVYSKNSKNILVGTLDGITVIDKNTFETVKNIKHPKIYGVHTIDKKIGSEDVFLITASGSDRVFEFNIETEEILWEWNPLLDIYNKNNLGLTIIDIENKDKIKNMEEIDYEKAEELMLNNVSVSNLYSVLDYNKIKSPLGIESWQNITSPNSAYYNPYNNEQIIVSLFSKGHAVIINKKSSKVEKIIHDSLKNPHSFLPFKDGFIVSDTLRADVLFFDKEFNLIKSYSFKNFPVHNPNLKNLNHLNWLQNTIPLQDDLLATIESKRNNIYIWNPYKKEYSVYKMNESYVAQGIFPN